MTEQIALVSGDEIDVVEWQKAAASVASGACVELGKIKESDPRRMIAEVAMRTSTDPSGPAILLESETLRNFMDDIRNGDFDKIVE